MENSTLIEDSLGENENIESQAYDTAKKWTSRGISDTAKTLKGKIELELLHQPIGIVS